jgi:hypothetical protein
MRYEQEVLKIQNKRNRISYWVIIGHGVDRHELIEIVLVGTVVASPTHHIERTRRLRSEIDTTIHKNEKNEKNARNESQKKKKKSKKKK